MLGLNADLFIVLCVSELFIGSLNILYQQVNKVKVTLVQALRLCTGRRVSRGIALLFL